MRRHRTTIFCLLAVLTLVALPAQAQKVWFVDADAPANGDGLSFPTAFRNLQDAIVASRPDMTPRDQIWVAAGTYTPGTNPGDRFELKLAVEIYGGFAGTETQGTFDPEVDVRDFEANETILSGLVNGVPNNQTIVYATNVTS